MRSSLDGPEPQQRGYTRAAEKPNADAKQECSSASPGKTHPRPSPLARSRMGSRSEMTARRLEARLAVLLAGVCAAALVSAVLVTGVAFGASPQLDTRQVMF